MDISISRISDSDKAIAATFNKSLDEIETHLNLLQDSVSSQSNDNGVVVSGVPATDSVSVGNVVYMTDSGVVAPAIMAFDSSVTDTGKSIVSASARVFGVVIAKEGKKVSVLISGAYTSSAVVQGCIGSDPVIGTYYLSSSVAGTVVFGPDSVPMAQPVLTCLGEDIICVSAMAQPVYNHCHTGYTLTGEWVPSADNLGYGVRYNGDEDLAGMGLLVPGSTVAFANGVLADIDIKGDELWAKTEDDVKGVVKLFTAMPASDGSGYIRSVYSSDGSVKSTVTHGIADISVAFDTQKGNPTGVAVSSISGTEVKTTPVVTSIKGVGMTTSTDKTGAVTLFAPGTNYERLTATEYNLNGAKRTSDNLYTYVVIPSTSTAGFTITRDIFTETPLNVSVWIDGISYTAKNLSVSVWFVPFPTENNPTQLAPEKTPAIEGTISSSGNGEMTIEHMVMGISEPIAATSGMLIAKITGDGSSGALKVLRAGFAVSPADK